MFGDSRRLTGTRRALLVRYWPMQIGYGWQTAFPLSRLRALAASMLGLTAMLLSTVPHADAVSPRLMLEV